ncbi:MAG: sugar phosphate isomerase/epimerase family protein [Halobacteriota archaeon]
MNVGLTVGDSIERIHELGGDFEFVELGIAEAGDPAADVDEDRLCDALDRTETDLHVHLPFTQVVATPVPEINDAIVTHQRRLLQWAASVGARKAVLHGTSRDPHDLDLRPTFRSQLRKIADAGRDAGVEVVVENVGHQPRGLQHTVLGDIARETDTSVCFDVGHAYMEDGTDGVERFAKRYGDLVSHLHVHDARSRGDTHLPIGAGEIDYSIVEAYFEGFDGTVAIEVFCDDRGLLTDTADRVASLLDGGR